MEVQGSLQPILTPKDPQHYPATRPGQFLLLARRLSEWPGPCWPPAMCGLCNWHSGLGLTWRLSTQHLRRPPPLPSGHSALQTAELILMSAVRGAISPAGLQGPPVPRLREPAPAGASYQSSVGSSSWSLDSHLLPGSEFADSSGDTGSAVAPRVAMGLQRTGTRGQHADLTPRAQLPGAADALGC